MSGKNARSRVQGGWSKAGLRPKSRSSSTNEVSASNVGGAHGQKLDSKALVYQDPKTIKMPAKKPYNFSWMVPGLLAGSGLPRHPAEVQYILDEGINILVSLTEWKPSLHLAPGLDHVHFPVTEFEPPSLKQAADFVAVVEQALKVQKKVAVHCHWGRGRTGCMLACYLVKSESMGADEAIDKTRRLRPHSVETYEQEILVHNYHKILHPDR